MNGIVNVYKPSGISSSAAVGKVKHVLGTRAVGHMGTLDPMGEGVLLMGVGKGTRLFDFYLKKTKTYEANFRFGLMTDTVDSTGTVTARTEILPSEEEIERALPSFIGEQDQIPPIYSAKSVGGVRAYKLARSGQMPELKPSRITVNELKTIGRVGENEYRFLIDCSAGTYVRSICRDIASALGSLAIMTAIKRTRCGEFTAEQAIAPENLTVSDIIPLERAVSSLSRVDLPDEMYKKAVNGVPIEANAPDGIFALFCRGELLGLAHRTERGIKIATYLKED